MRTYTNVLWFSHRRRHTHGSPPGQTSALEFVATREALHVRLERGIQHSVFECVFVCVWVFVYLPTCECVCVCVYEQISASTTCSCSCRDCWLFGIYIARLLPAAQRLTTAWVLQHPARTQPPTFSINHLFQSAYNILLTDPRPMTACICITYTEERHARRGNGIYDSRIF